MRLEKKIDPNDYKLIEKIRAGDGLAFKHLFFTYCTHLVNFARRYVKDLDQAENIVQEVFCKVWMNRTQLDASANIKTYLFTAVRNQSLKHLRHLQVMQRSQNELLDLAIPAKNPEELFEEKELGHAIQQAIASLPEKRRLIFSMNRFDQLTYAEIASILDISIKTVETQMGRALKFLREQLTRLELPSRRLLF